MGGTAIGWLGTHHRKPSDQMLAVLTGKMHHKDAPAAIQSLCSKAYFDAAMDLVALNDPEKIKKGLTRIPETCRDEVAATARKLWVSRARLLK